MQLEGNIATLSLPTSLRECIRLRLATVQTSDELLHALLRVACAMGGCFMYSTMLPVWRLLQPELDAEHAEQSMRAAVSRGVDRATPPASSRS